MEQAYCECAVKRKKTVMTLVIKILFVVIVVLLMLSTMLLPWFAILGVAAAGFLIWYWPRFDIMWEYVYCDGQIDFDRIMGGEKRKTDLRIEIEDADVIAPADSDDIKRFHDWPTKSFISLEEGARIYGIATRNPKDNTKKLLILFEPNDKMLDMMYSKCPRTVHK
ncbi:MAG: hypothetical protein J6P16_03380 [Eubacterium sp.]|nr:hypothetical protein [Eubacterium sp.]